MDDKEYQKQWYKKNKEKKYASQKKWRKKNKEKYNKYSREWQKENRKKVREYEKKQDIERPWRKKWNSIQVRLRPENRSSKYYFEKGIKNLLTLKDLEYLWFRDKAYEMKNPVLHRKDSNLHYTVSNCKYMEQGEHGRYHRKKRK